MKKQDRENRAGRRMVRAGLCVWICALFMSILCGCTRREQLLLEEEPDQPVVLRQGESGAAETVQENDVTPAQQVQQTQSQTAVSDSQAADGGAADSGIYVHICGAVNHPGVFVLPAGSRVFDAVEAAGGFAEDASADYLNQAQLVTDGCRIQIPTLEEAQSIAKAQEDPEAEAFLIQEDAGRNSAPVLESADGKVNINTADTAQLCTINGIGEGRAAAIIKYRETHGSFKSIEEIMNVTGIKQGTFDKIKEQISVK